MEAIIWAVTIAVGVFAAWFLIKVGTGFLVPPKKTGRPALKQMLQKLGVETTGIPDECIDEFVRISINMAHADRAIGKGYFNNSFVDSLNSMAYVIKTWIHGSEDEIEMYFQGDRNIYRDILERYDVH